MKQALSFDDVLLTPGKSIVNSRHDVYLETDFIGFKFKLPIMSANMSTVTEYDMCVAMHFAGGLGVIHRMMSIDDQCYIVKKLRKNHINMVIAATVECGSPGFNRSEKLLSAGCNIIFYDVAHAHSEYSLGFINIFLDNFPNVPLVIGNIATPGAMKEIYHTVTQNKNYHSKIALKVGIGSGSHCTTQL